MDKQQIQKTIQFANTQCENVDKKLTKKRQQVLEILLNANKPLSAYEVKNQFNKIMDSSIVAMSVYRILNVLESVNLVHRLKSENKYMPCSHADGGCHHQLSIFLICNSCHTVSEINETDELVRSLFKKVQATGFAPTTSQLEISGTCDECQQSTSELIEK
ncbi:Fur family transcriptional regulator [Pseudoalteromonas marina]|jgi:Fur family zinc uptake transcriptional regulator|uniref:Fur family transcriptional regulator n=1 Tax=Pseudoalteromonas marina TaxID=267375 RepID=A0ABT9FFF2_9GAMM|nr:Fur family transcriptional regulator [Pseudoalteromonas marina]EAW28256.1 Phospho-2-dehydro-3-deoxyheptonate aldolase, subtype 1 [Alteromonadales bacterium TW-7]MDP2565519.1 Fur family transcriptional regulator [Pseudoalteromonas marina]